ncbi:MAG: GerMN domain-containing protein [Leifsonia sp.]
MRSPMRAVAAAAAVLALLAGCASIPQSGSVHEGAQQQSDDALELDIIARGPSDGASQSEILTGFIDAAATPQGGYAVARQFLTTAFDNDWNPDFGATIDSGVDREFESTGELAMTVSITPVAAVSVHGEYAEEASAASVALPYEFQRVKGEWRISKAPQGILIDRPTFLQVFGAYPLYFYDPSFTHMVPDLRWFARRPSTPTTIVRELLAGPSAWLVGAVVSAFPEGTALTADTVQVIARDAQVPLNADALRADEATLQRMKLQLTESLSVPTISSVTISTNQIDQEIPDLAPYETPRVDSRALVMRGGVFGFLAPVGDVVTPIDGLSDAIAGLAPSAVTVGAGRTTAAVLSEAGVSVVRSGNAPVALDQRPGLIAPAIDTAGYVWSVPADAPDQLVAYGLDGTRTEVATSWPDSTRIVSLRLSRDSTRLIALLESGGTSRLVAAAIIRGNDERRQVPVQLGAWIPLAGVGGTPLDAAWVDDLTVVSLSQRSDGSTVLVTQRIGGPSDALDGTDGAVAVSGGNTVRDLRLLLQDGTLEQRQGIGWQPRIDAVQVLATQQGL